VPVQVVELTGSPDDVVVTHLHVFHARSPNTGTVPRLMLGKEIRRAGRTLNRVAAGLRAPGAGIAVLIALGPA
jgi:hypothetical protein